MNDIVRPRKTAIFFDTETTGLPLFSEPSEDPRQPHIVQLGALLVDMDTREILESLDVIVRPDGWVIPEEVSKIHGITHGYALEVGIPEKEAITQLLAMWGATADEPQERIGHNETFDARILRIGLKRYFGDEAADAWKAGKARCTAVMTTKIVKCPPTAKMLAAGRKHFKTPTLTEAYQHFFGRAFDGAHGAGADTKACMEVFFAVQDLERQAATA
jgi:DNA polymerase-3 subunit epsilon